MQILILIGLAGGLASAALFVAATVSGGAVASGIDGRILIYLLAALPAFLAGLGWGPVAAVAAAIAAGIGCGLLRGMAAGLMVFATQGLPMALVCYLAQLNRNVDVPGGEVPGGEVPDSNAPGSDASTAPPAATEWYPVGRLVAVAVLMAGVFALLTVLLLGTSVDEVRTIIRKLVENVFLKQVPGLRDRVVGEAEIQALTDIMLYAFPAAMALTWLGTFLMNFYIAGRVTLASGRLARPWPDLTAMAFPRGFGFGLAATLGVAAATTGYPALVASGFAGAILFAYLLLGLAILHHVSRGKPARPFMLWGVYAGLVILNPWAGLVVALLGVLEPFLPWRRSSWPGNPPS